MKVTLFINVTETIILLISLAHVVASATCSSQNPAPYELIFTTDSTTEQTGSITLICRDSTTAEDLDICETSFFLNRSSATDCSLRERGDIKVVEVGSTGIKFNLTRKYEGYYTCGRRVDCANVRESMSKTLISLQVIVPLLPPPQTNFTAKSGDRVVLPCPIQPGALLQQYLVTWKKGSTTIAEATNLQNITTVDDSRYKIDRATYSLVIDPITINDTSTDYLCELAVENPVTGVKQVLQPSPPVSLSLKVTEIEPTGYPAVSTTDDHEVPTCTFTDSSTIVITSFMYYIINTITVICLIF